ncbi:hypothetical protein [Hufsiella ginkgonis]|uniref:Uncharacterized protein n=1 Tax=Hufsiella ginkgonis TaxID=2695274 RepID=A0A7K1Y0D7_9SPHI|nr:hypothetical protein [Hufsiella ginkgonis]MXV16693.1 hypothetical protein [Hufsiella ginkgonis]
MKEIGGYFELELGKTGNRYHTTPYRLKSGRASLAFVLGILRPVNVYVPYYTCDALLEPLIAAGIPYTFYHINGDLEITSLPVLQPGELIIYINYYDIKRAYAEVLSGIYGDRLIVDCTQSYFLKGNGKAWFFNSTRKFFGVPDGSDLYVPRGYELDEAFARLPVNTNYVTGHLVARLKGDTRTGYQFFKENELLCGIGVGRMSTLTEGLLSSVDFVAAIETRRKNFNYLHQHFGATNLLPIDLTAVSSFYPYLLGRQIDKKTLWENNFYIPVLWADCLSRQTGDVFDTERKIASNLLPVPVDHRYTAADLEPVQQYILNNCLYESN